MSRFFASLLGALTVLPIGYFVFFVWFAFSSIAGSSGGSLPPFSLILPLHLGTMAITFALAVFYIVFLFRTPRIENDKKALWAVVLFLGNMLAFPVFWYLYIWRNCPPERN